MRGFLPEAGNELHFQHPHRSAYTVMPLWVPLAHSPAGPLLERFHQSAVPTLLPCPHCPQPLSLRCPLRSVSLGNFLFCSCLYALRSEVAGRVAVGTATAFHYQLHTLTFRVCPTEWIRADLSEMGPLPPTLTHLDLSHCGIREVARGRRAVLCTLRPPFPAAHVVSWHLPRN